MERKWALLAEIARRERLDVIRHRLAYLAFVPHVKRWLWDPDRPGGMEFIRRQRWHDSWAPPVGV